MVAKKKKTKFFIDGKPKIIKSPSPSVKKIISICESLEYPHLIRMRTLSDVSGVSISHIQHHSRDPILKPYAVIAYDEDARTRKTHWGNKKTIKEWRKNEED